MYLLNQFGYKELDDKKLYKIINRSKEKRTKILRSVLRMEKKDALKDIEDTNVLRSRDKILSTITDSSKIQDLHTKNKVTSLAKKKGINKKLAVGLAIGTGLTALGIKKIKDRKQRKDKGVIRGKYK